MADRGLTGRGIDGLLEHRQSVRAQGPAEDAEGADDYRETVGLRVEEHDRLSAGFEERVLLALVLLLLVNADGVRDDA